MLLASSSKEQGWLKTAEVHDPSSFVRPSGLCLGAAGVAAASGKVGRPSGVGLPSLIESGRKKEALSA